MEMISLTEFRAKHPDYLLIEEVARLIPTSPTTIKKIIKQGLIKPITLTRLRLSYSLLSPKDIDIIREYKEKYLKKYLTKKKQDA
jgi:hypothetical protein